MLALALLWGSGFLWIKIALWGLSPTQVTLTRLLLGAIVLVAIVYSQRLRLASGRYLWAHLAVAALFANAAPYLLFAVGEQTVSSSVAGIINCTTPLWTMLLAYASGHDRKLGTARLLGLLMGFVGTLLIFAPWSSGNQVVSWGGLACLGASLCYAISYLYMDRFLVNRGLPPLVLSASQLIAASGLMVLALPFEGLQAIKPRLDVLVAIVVLGFLGTGMAYVLNYRIIQDDGPVLASTVTYLLPIVAVILGWLVLAEVPTLLSLGGMAVVLAGVAMTRVP
ncbi:DMT family transporter [Nonomuraea lactucae]|uniref:DMT family transporter n=1 Tax=Nonomuraea lactucae TaxID=2249762 RepID=UPI001F070B37|nr:DMT family transporter [Nonomuraea lactucae]